MSEKKLRVYLNHVFIGEILEDKWSSILIDSNLRAKLDLRGDCPSITFFLPKEKGAIDIVNAFNWASIKMRVGGDE